jgi:hypothetical protein
MLQPDDVLARADLTSATFQTHFVVRDSATWAETWPRLYTESGIRPVPPLPTVDFQTHSVVVAMPLLSPPRHGAHVDSVVFHERGARVFVSQLQGGGTGGILEISGYTHVVRVPRLAMVEFEERTRNVDREGWPD